MRDHSSANLLNAEIDQRVYVHNATGDSGTRRRQVSRLDLPPFAQTSSLVNLFLDQFNAVLPLFHAETLLRMVNLTYQTRPQQRDPVVWAAINVVLALSYRYGFAGAENIVRSEDYFFKAQSVLSEVVLPSHVELLNVQVLVGLVMLMQGSQDLRPSSILIATTLRLAHSIGLHDRAFSAQLESNVARQRANVFWLAYITDKDLSLRLSQPSIQLDDDIDLDLPGAVDASVHEVDSGEHRSMTRTQVFEGFFLARIRLAVLEGAVYDYLVSTRSQKRIQEERLQALKSVTVAFEEWRIGIHPILTDTTALSAICPELLPFVPVLLGTSLLCTSIINQIHAMNIGWLNSLRECSEEGTVLHLPSEWERIVSEARDFMVLYSRWALKDRWNFW